MNSAVYIIRNKITNKFYIGSTKDFSYRKRQHLRDLKKSQHHSPILQRAFNKYGVDNLIFEVIEAVPNINQLLEREQYYIDTLHPEYNICSVVEKPPSRLGQKSTPEHCLHMSLALKGRESPMKGKKFTKEHRKKISAANRGKKNALGHKHSLESIELMKRKRKENPSRRPKNPVQAQQRRSKGLKRAWKRKSVEERKRIVYKTLKTKGVLRNLICPTCQNPFPYAWGKKTCGNSNCLSEMKRQALNKRRIADPDMDRRAISKRWQIQAGG